MLFFLSLLHTPQDIIHHRTSLNTNLREVSEMLVDVFSKIMNLAECLLICEVREDIPIGGGSFSNKHWSASLTIREGWPEHGLSGPSQSFPSL